MTADGGYYARRRAAWASRPGAGKRQRRSCLGKVQHTSQVDAVAAAIPLLRESPAEAHTLSYYPCEFGPGPHFHVGHRRLPAVRDVLDGEPCPFCSCCPMVDCLDRSCASEKPCECRDGAG